MKGTLIRPGDLLLRILGIPPGSVLGVDVRKMAIPHSGYYKIRLIHCDPNHPPVRSTPPFEDLDIPDVLELYPHLFATHSPQAMVLWVGVCPICEKAVIIEPE